MSHLSLVLDEVLADAASITSRKQAELSVVKTAASAPRSETAREMHALAASLRMDNDCMSYDDIKGVL